ncbi:MAG TPA: hypothetical protein HA348_02175 [Thermoplasmata archaeon]|nr:hypothetical protein [Thermoplasmata archaeon]
MNKKNLVIVVVLVLIAVFIGVMVVNMTEERVVIKEINYPGGLYASGIDLALKDNITSGTEELLRENLPVSFTARRYYWISPLYYTVIPLSEFNTLKETLLEEERIELTAVKREDEDIFVFFQNCFGKDDREYSITELQEHLDKYSLEAKEITWIYIEFDENVQYKEIEHTMNLLKDESDVIRAYPNLLEG